ncbi:MAG: PA14 domain-containing protein [Actinomycetota bacterium]|nr:PA14 domain-containing protein [Actinomycetota bacterium]
MVARRTERSKTFATDVAGRFRTTTYPGPVHFRDEAGKWQTIDTDLVANGAGRLQAKAGARGVDLAARADDDAVVRLSLDGDHSVAFAVEGAQAVTGQVAKNKLTYRAIRPGVDIELVALPNGVKDDLVLHSTAAPATYRFPLRLQGLTARVTPDGGVEYRDATGAVRVATPRPFMEDERRQRSYAASYRLDTDPQGATVLELSVERAWLDDPARAYPVRIDPTFFQSTGREDDTYIWHPAGGSYPAADRAYEWELNTGSTDNTNYARAYMNFELGQLNGKVIDSATFHIFQKWANSCTARNVEMYRVTQGWEGHSMTGPPGASVGDWLGNVAMGCDSNWRSWNITGTVRNWTSNVWAQHGLMLKAQYEPLSDTLRQFKSWNASGCACDIPHIDIYWTDPPSQATPQAPSDGASLHTLTPTLSATASDPNGDQVQYYYRVALGADAETSVVYNSGWTPSTSITLPANTLAWNTRYYWHVYTWDGVAMTTPNWVWSFRTTNSPPSVPTLTDPQPGAVSATATPTFSATSSDPDGDTPVKYRFSVATSDDGVSGTVVDSGWTTSSWTPRPGSLEDGRTYHWSAVAVDPHGAVSGRSSARSVRIDQRLGLRPSIPFDTLGPASVNLANGNLVVNAASPSFSTLAGPIGLSFAYNSQAGASGLTASYYNDNGNRLFDEAPAVTRSDANLNFSWGTGSPAPTAGVGADNFNVRWTGSLHVPSSGSYSFGTISDDGVRVWVNDTLVVDRWFDQAGGATPAYGPAMSLAAREAHRIKVEYYENAGAASLQLWARGQVPDQVLNPTWFAPDAGALPAGWSVSADLDADLAYASARVGDRQVVVVDATGDTHSFAWAGGGAYTSPPEQDAVLSRDATGALVLRGEDARTYRFRPDGGLDSVTSATDDRRSAPVYTWTGSPARLTRIADPVSGRGITLTYAPSTCPALSGYTTPSAGMLCRIDYSEFNGGDTKLYYSGSRLARVVDPGEETTDFAYDTTGRLAQVRDSLTNDLINKTTITDGAADTHKTLIGYDGAGRVSGVTAPEPSAGGDRPAHTYLYTPASGTAKATTEVRVAGIAEPYARRVTLNGIGRLDEDRDGAGNVVTFEWDAGDRLVRSTDAKSRVSTTIYDEAGRPTKTFGPGQANEFGADRQSTTAPKIETAYDERMDTLAATWWDNKDMTGAPVAHGTSAAQESWGARSPAGVPVDNFSGQLTGEVDLPSAGQYGLTLTADGGRVFIDDKMVIDRWDGPYRNEVLADAPRGYWRLGDARGASAALDATGAAHGAYAGGVTRGVAGALGGDSDTSASFDGVDGHVALPAGLADFSAGTAVEAWVKPTGNRAWERIFDLGNGPDADNIVFSRWDTSNDLMFYVSRNGAGQWITAPSALVPNVWQHLAATLTPSGQATIYRNGAVVAQGSVHTPAVVTRTRNYIGRPNWAGDHYFGGQIDEAAVYSTALPAARLAAHANAGQEAASQPAITRTTPSLTAGKHRIRIDYQELTGDARLNLSWTPPDSSSSPVPAAKLKPRFGLATSSVDADNKRTETEYAEPATGLATASVVDPAGANLRTVTTYEGAGTGFLRRKTKRLPKGAASEVRYDYFGATETADNPCTAKDDPVNQAGALKTSTAADPDGAGAGQPIVREFRYDLVGRPVAARVQGDTVWSCTAYDPRGRVTSRSDSQGRTTTIDYSVPAQVTTTEPDSSGTTRTTVAKVDWLGRAVAYTDEWGTTTRTAYDQAGRVKATYRAFSGQAEAQVTSLAYDAASRVSSLTEYASGVGRTTSFTYDPTGAVETITRPNGVVTTNGYDPARATLRSVSHAKAGVELSPWNYTYSPAGRTSTEGTTGRSRSFNYDGARRLIKAVETAAMTTTRNYSYDANTNRCSTTTSCNGSYLYDDADRLTASPEATDYRYDAHGNLRSAVPTKQPLGNLAQAFGFDASEPAPTKSYAFTAGQPGTVDATLDWAPAPLTQTPTSSGTVPAAGSASATTYAYGKSRLGSTLTWTKGLHRPTASSNLAVPAASSATKTITTDGAGDIVASLDYPAAPKSYSASGTVAGTSSTDHAITPTGNGTISVTLSWPTATLNPNLDLELLDGTTVVASSRSLTGNSETVNYSVTSLSAFPASKTYTLRVVAVAVGSSYSLSGTYPVTPTVGFELTDAAGTKLASSTPVSGQRRRTLSHPEAPAGTYGLKATSDLAVTTTLTETHTQADFADVTLALKNPGGAVVVQTRSSSGRATLAPTIATTGGSYTWAITNHSTGLNLPSYTLSPSATTLGDDTASGSLLPAGTASRAVVADGAGEASATLTWTADVAGTADLTLALKSSSGAVVASGRSASGTVSVTGTLPAAGTYTWAITNNSLTAGAPSYTLASAVPRVRSGSAALALKNSAGQVVASATGTKPQRLTTDVAAGDYTFVATPTGAGDGNLAATYPLRKAKEVIDYDGNDHAVRIDDGNTVVAETLNSSGRVLRRVVSESVTGVVAEDVTYGYAGPGDSPSYSRPSAGGPVTTYLAGPGGLSVIDTAGVPSYPLANGHGDVVGNTDVAGLYVANPAVDEFGKGQPPPNRLGWLGTHQRFSTGGNLNLIRMGVRLYDPALGRFLQVDPVEGGSANDYDYAEADPINGFDLDGRLSFKCLVAKVFGGCKRRAPQGTKTKPHQGQLVYRVFGGSTPADGSFWTPVNPHSLGPGTGTTSYRNRAGLPDENPGTFVVVGRLTRSSCVVRSGRAAAYTSRKYGKTFQGGLPEYLIPDPFASGCVVEIRRYRVDPPF